MPGGDRGYFGDLGVSLDFQKKVVRPSSGSGVSFFEGQNKFYFIRNTDKNVEKNRVCEHFFRNTIFDPFTPCVYPRYIYILHTFFDRVQSWPKKFDKNCQIFLQNLSKFVKIVKICKNIVKNIVKKHTFLHIFTPVILRDIIENNTKINTVFLSCEQKKTLCPKMSKKMSKKYVLTPL